MCLWYFYWYLKSDFIYQFFCLNSRMEVPSYPYRDLLDTSHSSLGDTKSLCIFSQKVKVCNRWLPTPSDELAVSELGQWCRWSRSIAANSFMFIPYWCRDYTYLARRATICIEWWPGHCIELSKENRWATGCLIEFSFIKD